MTQSVPQKVLLIRYGNPAREDDGLGPAAAQSIESLNIEGVTVETDYQLTVEDAADIAEYQTVVFIDASANSKEPFIFYQLAPAKQADFSSHSIEPETVLALANSLFNADTEAYMLCIRGYSFDMFKENITERASQNLKSAMAFMVPILHSGAFQQATQNLLLKST